MALTSYRTRSQWPLVGANAHCAVVLVRPTGPSTPIGSPPVMLTSQGLVRCMHRHGTPHHHYHQHHTSSCYSHPHSSPHLASRLITLPTRFAALPLPFLPVLLLHHNLPPTSQRPCFHFHRTCLSWLRDHSNTYTTFPSSVRRLHHLLLDTTHILTEYTHWLYSTTCFDRPIRQYKRTTRRLSTI